MIDGRCFLTFIPLFRGGIKVNAPPARGYVTNYIYPFTDFFLPITLEKWRKKLGQIWDKTAGNM